jgi:hypothetical protein
MASDIAEYTGQYFESDGQVYARVPSFFFSSEIGLTVVRRPPVKQAWQALGNGLAFGRLW